MNFKTLENLCRCPTGGCKCGKGKSNEGVWITSAKNPILTFFYPIEQVFSPNRHRVILLEKEIYYSVSAFKKYRLYYTKKWELPLWKSQWLHLTAVDLTWKHTSTHTSIGYGNICNFTKLWKWRLSTLLGIFYQSNRIHLANKTALSRIGLMTSFKETLSDEIKLLMEEERNTLGSQRTMGRYWVHQRTRGKRLDKKVQNRWTGHHIFSGLESCWSAAQVEKEHTH